MLDNKIMGRNKMNQFGVRGKHEPIWDCWNVFMKCIHTSFSLIK